MIPRRPLPKLAALGPQLPSLARTAVSVGGTTGAEPVEAPRVLRLTKVMQMTGMPRSSVYAAISRGEFPRQVKLTRRCVGWRASEIEAWLHSRKPAE